MYNPDYKISDLDLLAKYGLKPYSNHEELSLQVALLYCLKNGYSLKLDEDIQCQVSTLCELKKILPVELAEVLEVSMARPHRFYDPEIAMSVYQASKKTDFLGTSEYSQLLVALIQNSEPFILNGCCDYRQTLFLAEILKDSSCNYLDYDEKKYPFLRAILSDKVSLNYQHDDTYRDDVFYRFLINEMSAPSGICPPEKAEDADPSISGFLYDVDGSLYSVDEYMETIGGGCLGDLTGETEKTSDDKYESGYNFTILSSGDFSQTFFRFSDRYEFYDCILVPYLKEWQNNSAKEREIRSCIEERVLSNVISDGNDSYILLQRWGDDMVRFKSYCDGRIVDFPNIPSGEDGVSYEDIAENQYSLNPYLYMVTDCDEDHKLVRLRDICSIDEDRFEDFLQSCKSFTLLPDYSFAKDLIDIYRNVETKRQYGLGLPDDVNRLIYFGPHIHISKDGEFILSDATGYYACPERANWALCVNGTEVSMEYLTYVLLNSGGFKEFLASEPSAQTLLNKKIAILRDHKKQEEAVAEFKTKNMAVVNSSHVYNVALLVTNCPDWIKITMEECWYLKIQEFEHVIGDGGLLEILDKGLASFDAVIVDAAVDSVRDRYKGLRELLSKTLGDNLPIYLYTEVEDEPLREDLSEQEYKYLKNGRYFNASDDTAMEILVRELRNELDGQDNQSAEMRGKYLREFEAAEWLERRIPRLNLVPTLTFSLSQPNKSFTALRGVLNGLYKAIMMEISNGSGLDLVKTKGMLPLLLRDGKYVHHNQVVFLIKGVVMPLPLAVSLCYASQIVNGAVHEEDVEKMDVNGYLSQVRSEHLAQSVIRILMDFILWLYEVNFEFDGHCESRDANVLEPVQLKGILQQANPEEYYCDTEEGRVHVIVQKGQAKIGAEIVITQVRYETRYYDRYTLLAPACAWSYKEDE